MANGEDQDVTTPIEIVHAEMIGRLTIPIPRKHAVAAMVHNVGIAPPPPSRTTSALWKRLALGVVAGAMTVAGIVVAFG